MKNRLYHSSIDKSPFEVLYPMKRMNLKKTRVFGCRTFVYNGKLKSKAHARASPGILLGIDDNGVYLGELATGEVVKSVHCTFDEECFPGLDDSDSSTVADSSGSEWETSNSDVSAGDDSSALGSEEESEGSSSSGFGYGFTDSSSYSDEDSIPGLVLDDNEGPSHVSQAP